MLATPTTAGLPKNTLPTMPPAEKDVVSPVRPPPPALLPTIVRAEVVLAKLDELGYKI
jgi:hypothetical protein